jgi:EpsI family protein
MLSRKHLVVSLGLLGLLALYVRLLPPHKVGAAYLDLCPRQIAGLPGRDLALDQTVLDDLNADATLSRLYKRANGLPLWLVIVYFENARLGLHDPYLCYRSQGFAVEDLPGRKIETDLGEVPVQTFRAARGDRHERVYYFWYSSGRTTLANVKTFRDRMFFDGLKRNRSFGAFIRVSTLEDGDTDASDAALETFIQKLAPLLPKFFPEPES